LEEILETFFARPDRGEERKVGGEMESEHEPRPEKTDRADDQQPMPAKPVHSLILGKLHFPASANFCRRSQLEKRARKNA
jgi:hypothetical protein